jgi:hypothetical protein
VTCILKGFFPLCDERAKREPFCWSNRAENNWRTFDIRVFCRPDSNFQLTNVKEIVMNKNRKKKTIAALALISLIFFSATGALGNSRAMDLKPTKHHPEASGSAMIDNSQISVEAHGLNPDSVYTVWFVNTSPKKDETGAGKAPYIFWQTLVGSKAHIRSPWPCSVLRSLGSEFSRPWNRIYGRRIHLLLFWLSSRNFLLDRDKVYKMNTV